jgi:copper(I)-binding protein
VQPNRVAAALVLVTAATGCAAGRDAGEVIDTLGTNAEAGSVLLRNVRVERPQDGVYRDGDHARVYLTLVNEADRPDRLLDVTTTHAQDVEQRWDEGCDGTAERVAALPLVPGGTVPSPAGVDEIGRLPYHLVLTDITTTTREGTTIPLTFTFAEAEPETVDAMVQSHPHETVDGLRACVPEPVPSTSRTEET